MKIEKYLEKNNRIRLSFCDPDVRAGRMRLKSLLRSALATDLGDVQQVIIQRLEDLVTLTTDNLLNGLATRQLNQFNADLLDQMWLIYHATGEPDFETSIPVRHYLHGPR